ncbi:cysteine proteinase [Gonapodya prolifera JEL478]|uniref:Cysteine proteinase n=1 Tax=Gonapodya prolifera (strain JEL478) TaxID=1344416 RepID=A0A139A502_GONPJ|nr:cysteine proteinase [Gonapodya prolifera JEL478]|eukprot:KXS11699.1 cysteine proteinase [Gonapodya prolifera JEL478]
MARKKDAATKGKQKPGAKTADAAPAKVAKDSESYGKGKGKRERNTGQWVDDDCGELNAQLRLLGLRLSDVSGDGNCLFRALSDQMHGNPNSHHVLIRAQVCDYMAQHRDSFAPFCDEDDPFDRHLARMRRDGTYGENLEVVAFARAGSVDVAVHQMRQPVWIVRAREDGRPVGRMIHIVYHSWEHYSSVRNLAGPATGPPQIRITPTAPHPPPSASGASSSSSTGTSTAKTPPPANHPTSLERMIMQTTGEEDFRRVRALLDKYRMNVNRVFEELWQEGYGASVEEDEAQWAGETGGDKAAKVPDDSTAETVPDDGPTDGDSSSSPAPAPEPTAPDPPAPRPETPPASTATDKQPARPSRNAAKRDAKRAQKERALEKKRAKNGAPTSSAGPTTAGDANRTGGSAGGAASAEPVGQLVDGMRTVTI